MGTVVSRLPGIGKLTASSTESENNSEFNSRGFSLGRTLGPVVGTVRVGLVDGLEAALALLAGLTDENTDASAGTMTAGTAVTCIGDATKVIVAWRSGW